MMEKKSEVKNKNVHSGHRKRVKLNVRQNGFSQLEDHRLLELLLFYSIPQADTNGIAHNLLSEFGSLEEVFNQTCSVLERVGGVGENSAIMICAMQEAYKRISKSKLKKKPVYKNTSDYVQLASEYLADAENERLVVFCFDSAKRLKKAVTVAEGNRISTSFDVRTVIRAVMDSNAEFVVLAHNHPTEMVEPSGSDIDTTRSLCVTLRKIGVFVADHIIVGKEEKSFSMYSEPKLRQMFF